MDGRAILESLKQMCRDIDAGRPLRRVTLGRALGPAIIGFSLVAGGCPEDSGAVSEYSAPMPPPAREVCFDGIDNDRDGRLDCADDDCAETCTAVQMYGAPLPHAPVAEICDDGADNDGDGRVDCADDGCSTYDACQALMDYAAPFPVIVAEPPADDEAE